MPDPNTAAVGAGASETVPDSGDFRIDNILSGARWTGSSLTYSFPSTGSLYDYYPSGGFVYGGGTPPWYWYGQHAAFTEAQKTAVRDTMSMISSFTGLTFTETTEMVSSHADLRFSQLNTVYESSRPPISGFDPTMFGEPGKVPQGSERAEAGDAWFSTTSFNGVDPTVGTVGFFNIMRGVAATLGLEAGGNSPDTSIFFGQTLGEGFDYNAYFMPGSRMPQSLMQQDIAALQYLYGADFSVNSGATTYRWHPTTGEQSVDGVGQGIPSANYIYRTIWDGGGKDTYDLSNYTTNLEIDLEPGAFSNFYRVEMYTQLPETQLGLAIYAPGDIVAYDYAEGNVANALLYNGDTRSLIENAVGGSGIDWIKGNIAANHLSGRAGNDALLGRLGNDVLQGGSGADVLIGDDISSGIGFGAGMIVIPKLNEPYTYHIDYDRNFYDHATDITDNFFIFDDPNVADSDFVPHQTLQLSDHFSRYFRIDLKAGTTLTLDIDGHPSGTYSAIFVLDQGRNILDRSQSTSLDPGSVNYNDPYVVYTAPTTGTYYIQLVGNNAQDYRLHVSAEGPGSQIGMGSGLVTKTADQILHAPNNDLRESIKYALDLTNTFSLAPNTDIASSTVVPHTTVKASTGENGYDFYHIRLQAGSVITIDIDGTTPAQTTDISLRIFDSTGSLGSGPYNDNMTGPLDPGSTNAKDSYLTYTVPDTGDYYIMVDNYYNRAYDYTLHLSVQEQDFGAPTGSTDTASYADATAAVTASLGDATINLGDAKGDKYISIENLTGSNFNDTLSGDKAANVINGGKGNDTAVFSSKRSDYTVATLDNGSLRITDNRSGGLSDGTDTLIGVEKIKFSDTTITAPSGNEAPEAIALSGTKVKEKVPLGTTVGTFSARDPEGKALTYTLTDNADGLFKLSGATLVTATAIDYEKVRSDNVTVAVSDGTNIVSKTFTITVENMDEAPTTLALSARPVMENVRIGTMVGTFSATDPEGKALTYTLTDNADGLFRLSGTKLVTAKSVDYEKLRFDTVTVEVSDGTNAAIKTFNIGVQNVNEAPNTITLSNTGVREDKGPGSIMGLFSATDPEGRNLTYKLLDDAGGRFLVSENRLMVGNTRLDYETLKKDAIKVEVSDGINTATRIFVINLQDVNEKPPNLKISNTTIKENKPVGTAVGAFSARDPEGKTLNYKLLDDAGDLFKLSGAKLVTAKAIDYEKVKSDTVKVAVSDGVNTVTETFTITVDDVNEAARIHIDNNKIREGSSVGATVGTIYRFDPEGENVKLKLIDDAGGLFRLFGVRLVTAKALDHDKVQKDTVIIEVSDGVNKTNATFNIRILDENDNPQIGDTIVGNSKGEWLFGYDSDDILIGNGGFDELTGGLGKDRFVFKKVSDMGISDDATDYITDFIRSQGDVIDFSAIDANVKTTRNDAFTYIGSEAFSKTPGELRAQTEFKSFLYKVSGDVDGDGKADFQLLVHLKALSDMMASEFIL
ncbi:hypothetical protein ASG39_21400 [Rhizobium sp. Leaf371]|uniref:pre-peptidase C-terminal domain-containing protein n=1 Tax=Rhizobium sp. Leaf371 TaxID=1736355 RepID=UPI000713949A|nr:pre-peptidase C-terminal domain-containing protein [Rhizobium sp. Leaf371]KQS71400.1 hypothetical protein ASG39_21400 [Rhizobium sp. Leaf371]